MFPFSGTENTHRVFFAKYFSVRLQFFKIFESHMSKFVFLFVYIYLLAYIGNNDVLSFLLK